MFSKSALGAGCYWTSRLIYCMVKSSAAGQGAVQVGGFKEGINSVRVWILWVFVSAPWMFYGKFMYLGSWNKSLKLISQGDFNIICVDNFRNGSTTPKNSLFLGLLSNENLQDSMTKGFIELYFVHIWITCSITPAPCAQYITYMFFNAGWSYVKYFMQ